MNCFAAEWPTESYENVLEIDLKKRYIRAKTLNLLTLLRLGCTLPHIL